jgi:hypothetical protein
VPLFYEWPNDAQKHEENYIMYFADTFLVAPVYEQGASSRGVVFPEGRWHRYGAPYSSWLSGPLISPVPVTAEDTPVYLREGRIAAIYENVGSQAHTTIAGNVTLVVGPNVSGSAVGHLWLDDGWTFDCTRGDYLHVKFERESDGTIRSTRDEVETSVPALLQNSYVNKIVIYGAEETRVHDGLGLRLSDSWVWQPAGPGEDPPRGDLDFGEADLDSNNRQLRDCGDMRFCRDHIGDSPGLYSILPEEGAVAANVYAVPIHYSGGQLAVALKISQLSDGPFRIRVEPTETRDKNFRYDLAADARVLVQETVNSLATITSTVEANRVTIQGMGRT